MAMFDKVLIANRGEIARRILRTAKRLGIKTVAIYSEADKGLLFVSEADEAIAIGPAAARESYLAQEKIIAAARSAGAGAIHPGYGFLSENAEFAEAVEAAGIAWIGAPPAAIRAMGLKDAAKELMKKAGVPVTPGYMGSDRSPARLKTEAQAIGYPVLIKAVAGGGGKGMRRVDDEQSFLDALESCKREAAAAFGDDRVLIEKYVRNPRHIEVQVFGDKHGNVIHLFERDCSLQRRHQKLIEEAPAPGMDEATRTIICTAAVQAAKSVRYVGAGTIEFIADSTNGLCAGRIWFMEMNTRLQVEHPVTEEITGQDLVEWQIRVAAGEPLPRKQNELSINGWAMEARLYSENPATGFLPSTGTLQHLKFPAGVRVESGFEEGNEVTSHYDPMIAKVVVHAPDRMLAAAALADAMSKVEVWPVKSNAAFLARAAGHPSFKAGQIDTGFIERFSSDLIAGTEPSPDVLNAVSEALVADRAGMENPWSAIRGFRLNRTADMRTAVEVAGKHHVADGKSSTGRARVIGTGFERVLFIDGEAWQFCSPASAHLSGQAAATDGSVLSPMPGRVVAVEVEVGQAVKRGQKLLVVEAMKMELALVAPFDGSISALKAVVGQQVTEGLELLRVTEEKKS